MNVEIVKPAEKFYLIDTKNQLSHSRAVLLCMDDDEPTLVNRLDKINQIQSHINQLYIWLKNDYAPVRFILQQHLIQKPVAYAVKAKVRIALIVLFKGF